MFDFFCKIGIHAYKVKPCSTKEAGQCIKISTDKRLVCVRCGKLKIRKAW